MQLPAIQNDRGALCSYVGIRRSNVRPAANTVSGHVWPNPVGMKQTISMPRACLFTLKNKGFWASVFSEEPKGTKGYDDVNKKPLKQGF
jgi:hypothetical protein